MANSRDSFFLTKNNGKDTQKQNKPNKNTSKKRRDAEFDKNRQGVKEEESSAKKPFDKKTYRLKKYSKKYKLEQWEEQRKKKLLKNYYNEFKKDVPEGNYKPIAFDKDETDSSQEVGKYVRHPDFINNIVPQNTTEKTKKDPFSKAKEHYNKIKQEKMEKRQQVEKENEERKKKLQEYKKKKQEKFKKLSKKTKRGQPVMSGRLELLLEKIQKS